MATGKPIRYGCSECAKALRASNNDRDTLAAALSALEEKYLTLAQQYDRLQDDGIPKEIPETPVLSNEELGEETKDLGPVVNRPVRSGGAAALLAHRRVLHGYSSARVAGEPTATGPVFRSVLRSKNPR